MRKNSQRRERLPSLMTMGGFSSGSSFTLPRTAKLTLQARVVLLREMNAVPLFIRCLASPINGHRDQSWWLDNEGSSGTKIHESCTGANVHEYNTNPNACDVINIIGRAIVAGCGTQMRACSNERAKQIMFVHIFASSSASLAKKARRPIASISSLIDTMTTNGKQLKSELAVKAWAN